MGSDRRLVSVIVPAYNCEHFIKTCIDSIQGQTYRCFEVIVVYDPSPDNTLSVLEKYRRDIVLIKQKRKTSPAIARNEGLKIAKGQYIAFCDVDDYFESRKLQRQIKLMEEKDADITYTDVIYVDRNNNMFGLKFPEVSKDNIGSWMANPYIALSSICVKKNSRGKF